MRWYETVGQASFAAMTMVALLPPVIQRFLDLLWWIRR
jgi:hypothetical protein